MIGGRRMADGECSSVIERGCAWTQWRDEHTQPYQPGMKNIIVTYWTWDKSKEPVYDSLLKAAGQEERGNLLAKEQRIHRHDAILIGPDEDVQEKLLLVYPVTGLDRKDIRAAKQGNSFRTFFRYCTKESHRVKGTDPQYHNCGPEYEQHRKETVLKRTNEERDAYIQGCDTKEELCKQKLFRCNPAMATTIRANRPLLQALGKRVSLFGFEHAIVDLLERQPKPADMTVNFFVTKHALVADPERIATMLVKVASRRGQAAQIAIHDATLPTIDSLRSHLSPLTRVIFVVQFDGQNMPLGRFSHLKTTGLIRTPDKHYDLQEIGPRHVCVFTNEEPDFEGKVAASNFKVWDAAQNGGRWPQLLELLESTQDPESGRAFLDLETLGSSGMLVKDLESMA